MREVKRARRYTAACEGNLGLRLGSRPLLHKFGTLLGGGCDTHLLGGAGRCRGNYDGVGKRQLVDVRRRDEIVYHGIEYHGIGRVCRDDRRRDSIDPIGRERDGQNRHKHQ